MKMPFECCAHCLLNTISFFQSSRGRSMKILISRSYISWYCSRVSWASLRGDVAASVWMWLVVVVVVVVVVVLLLLPSGLAWDAASASGWAVDTGIRSGGCGCG